MPADLVDRGHRFEAWTDPNVGTFARKFDLSRHVTSYTIADKYSSISDGEFGLPPDFAKRDLLFKVDKGNHANDVASIIRVLDGTTPELHYVLKKLDGRWSSSGQTITAKLEGMDYFLDKALVPNFDAPVKPYVEPDWHYGLPSILHNTDFEDTGFTNLVIHVWLQSTVTAGTWTMTFDAQTTSALAWNIDITALQTAIEALSNIADISISGAGTETNPWVIQVIDPAGTDFNVSTNPAGLTGGVSQILSMVQGGAGIVDPWTKSFNPITGQFHGTYTNFEISTVQAHTGTQSLYVKGALGPWPESYPGAQQIISATGGRLYRHSFWVYPKFARRYRFGLRSTDETWIADFEADLTANSWQELKFSATVPTHLRQVIFRVACISNTDGHEFYVDDALFAPGMDAATYGKIMGQLLAACQAAGYLTWVTKTWSDTHDSAGVAWDRDLVWSVKHRQSLLQLVEYADRWNYESDGIHWSIANSRFEWGLYNPGGGGVDRLGTGIAVIGKYVGETGTQSEERPDATQFYAEGDLGYWNEFEDATLAGAWGPLQRSFFNAQGLDTAGLLELATRLVADAGNRTAGLVTRLQAAPIKPWVDFKPGDRNVMVNLEPLRPREYQRCMAIVATKGEGDATPTYEAHWDSVVYQGEAAVLETVRRLVRKFEAQRPVTHTVDATPSTPIPPPSPAVASTEVIIAAFDTHDYLKEMAHYVCTGADDQITWRQMLTDLGANPTVRNGGKGRVKVLDGNYLFEDRLTFSNEGFGKLQFVGEGLPIIKMGYNTVSPTDGFCPLIWVAGSNAVSSHTPLSFENIHFDGNSNSNAICLFQSQTSIQPMIDVKQCFFSNWINTLWWTERTCPRWFHHNQILNCAFPASNGAFWFDSTTVGPSLIHDNVFEGCSGNMVWGFGFADHAVFHHNFEVSGTMVLNALAGVNYLDNFGF